MRENSSEIKFTKEDREKLQEELEREREEELEKEEEKKEDEEKKNEEKEKKKDKKKTKHKTKTKHKKDKDKSDKDRKKKKDDNKSRIPWSYIIILLLIIAVVAAIGVYYYLENEKDVDLTEEWQEAYYTFLENGMIKKGKDASGNALSNSSLIYQEKNPKMYFLDVEEYSYPVMITESTGIKDEYQTNENSNAESVYKVHMVGYNNKVSYNTYYNIDDIELLYNVDTKSSGWYLHKSDENTDTYTAISNKAVYNFESDEEFEDTFEEIDTHINKYKIVENTSENRLKNTIVKATDSMKKISDIIDDDTINKIEDKRQKETTDETEEEIEETEQEDKKEEVKETYNGLKAGEYTISFGTYKSNAITLTLKNNKTCTYKDTENDIDEACSYSLEGDSNSGFQLVVKLENDTKYYIVSGNNKLGNLEYQK